ncbi:MAG: hypothetical protein JKY43_04795 [Phycisphaerales bacterium]|nr:hypothetical protein [Phycisphaerales bacterium]
MHSGLNIRVGKLGLTVAIASVSLLWGVGCVSYTSVPEPSRGIAIGHTNSGGSIKTIVASLERVVVRHRMRDEFGKYAVNLPVGTTPETAEIIISRLPVGAILPYEGMGEAGGLMPVYHIGRIWLRGSSGKVDVVYPMLDAGGQRIDGGVTVWVHGGDRPWYIKRMQYWAPGTVPTPLMYVPLDGNVGVGGSVDFQEEAIEGDLDGEAGFDGGDETGDDQVLYREVGG